jgi:hypothetical protein
MNKPVLYRIAIPLGLMSLAVISFGQVATQRGRLNQIAAEAQRVAEMRRQEARNWALLRGWPIRVEEPDGRIVEIMAVEDNRPIYFSTLNHNAAISVGANHVYAGGADGLSLNGAGVILGVWDGGRVLTTHTEFGGRVTQRDGATSNSSHATHVTGTMAATGIDSRAKGMSFAANIWSHDWGSDISEMASRAAEGLRASNHSYGTIAGWQANGRGDGRWVWNGTTSISETFDWQFGFYNTTSRNADLTAYNAPFYLPVIAAGNDRNDGPTSQPVEHWVRSGSTWVLSSTVRQRDGGPSGFDCLPQGLQTAKNVLTVGAVNDVTNGYNGPASVVMSSFSSWGPTDDGRIKPDVVGNGVNLFSTTTNGGYTTLSGTSMAAPNVSGSLGLLIQYFRQTHGGADMRAATLRALVIHTADEAGSTTGPDYTFGWGLLNVRAAARTIGRNLVVGNTLNEAVLQSGQVIEQAIYADGTQPLRATLSWTDPAGAVTSAALNNRTPKLVNDLDLRIVGPGGTHMPWILNPDSPANAAARADNIRDNVEQVLVQNPQPGYYTVRISAKNALQPSGSQAFSLVLTGQSNLAAGSVQLEAFVGNYAGESVAVQVRVPGTTQVLETHNVQLGANGQLLFPTQLVGTYDVAVKGRVWLRRVVQGVVFNAQGVAGLAFPLFGGDVNGDNTVNLVDHSLLSNAFRSRPGDANWNPNADLNGDGVVNLADFSILSGNFRRSGDQ